MRCASAITTCMSCSTMRIVRSLAMRRTSSMVSWVSAALMPAVGSSMQSSWGAVRADDCANFAAPNLEIDVIERRQSAEADGEPLGAQQRGGCAFPDWGREGRIDRQRGRHLGRGELAVRREHRLFLGDHLEDA